MRSIIYFCITYAESYGDRIFPLVEKGTAIAKATGYEAGELMCVYNTDFHNVRTPSKGTAFASPEIMDRLRKDPDFYLLAKGFQAYSHWFAGDYTNGFNTIFECIREAGDAENNGPAWNLYALGIFYFDTKDFESSGDYYGRAFRMFEKLQNKYGMARSANGMASVAIQMRDLDKAATLLSFAKELYRELGHHSGLSRALNDIGMMEKEKGNYDAAVDSFTESLRLREEIGHLQGMITTLTELGETYLLLEGYETSLGFFKQAAELSKVVGSKQKEMRLHHLIYKACKALGDTAGALGAFESYYELRTELLSDETANSIKKMQTRFEKEKAEKETEIERLRNVELKRAYAIIEEKNKDIRDSINYARRIQQAILADEEEIRSHFPSSFLIYRPKDVVAGDFYFFEKTDTHLFYAAADCTGHGVPGALMSVVCSNALTRCVREFGLEMPGEILDKARELVLSTFRKSGTEIKDGMDISFLVKDILKNKYYWSGANNPLWIFSGSSFTQIAADKQPIGFSEHGRKFTTHTLAVSPGDKLFLLTDGYADQFGGPKGKKFKDKQLIALLESNVALSPEALKNCLISTLEDWKGNLEQVDDICVIGVWAE